MLCPVCGFENLTGTRSATTAARTSPETTCRSRRSRSTDGCSASTSTTSAHPPPLTVGPDTPVDAVIARMHEAETDCVLVTVDDRLVGIFTDRDAVVKAAGKRLDAVPRAGLHDARPGRPAA